MIALILAAAVAGADLDAAITSDTKVWTHQGITQIDDKGRAGMSASYERTTHCLAAQRALHIAGWLQQAIDLKQLTVKVAPRGDETKTYPLRAEDLPVVAARMHAYETEAKVEQVSCGG